MKKYSSLLLRVGIAIVFLWFGINELLTPDLFVSYIPDFIVNLTNISASTLLFINAIIEIVFGLLILFGIYVRLFSILLSIHLLLIIIDVGLTAIGIRDVGIMFSLIALAINGKDECCVK